MSSTGHLVILHGYNGSPTKHWFGWLTEALSADGVTADVPELPDAGAPEPAAWDAAIGAALAGADDRTVVVAHSLGCVAALRVLGREPRPLGGLVLVAPFAEKLPSLPDVDAFVDDLPHLPSAVQDVAHRLVVRSDNDDAVPAAMSDRLAAELDAEVVVVPGTGHLTESDGVVELPQVRDAVRRWLGA